MYANCPPPIRRSGQTLVVLGLLFVHVGLASSAQILYVAFRNTQPNNTDQGKFILFNTQTGSFLRTLVDLTTMKLPDGRDRVKRPGSIFLPADRLDRGLFLAEGSSRHVGPSFIVGPAEPADRPLAEIHEDVFNPQHKSLRLNYVSAGHASLNFDVSRTVTAIEVEIAYPTDEPFTRFRSLFVAAGNCNTERVAVFCRGQLVADLEALDPLKAEGDEFDFYGVTQSIQNQSGPDIRILIDTVGEHAIALLDRPGLTGDGWHSRRSELHSMAFKSSSSEGGPT